MLPMQLVLLLLILMMLRSVIGADAVTALAVVTADVAVAMLLLLRIWY